MATREDQRIAPSITGAVRVIGEPPLALQTLLEDILEEMGLPMGQGGAPSLVLAIPSRHNMQACLQDARRVASRAPVVAILPVGDDRMQQLARALGADACFPLDAPIARLQQLLHALLTGGIAPALVNTPLPRPVPTFRLGGATRTALATLREAPPAESAIPEDAEQRLEQAMGLDLFITHLRRHRGNHTAPGLGTHARLELVLMRLGPAEVEQLERALLADLRQAG